MDNKISMNTLVATLTIIAASVLVGCGGSSDSEPEDSTPTPTTNTVPVANNDSFAAQFNVANEIMVLTNDSDPDGDTLSITNISYSGAGIAEITGTSISYNPATDFLGTEQLTYTISDGKGGEASASVEIDVGIEFTIRGKVTDSPIANANVTVDIGDEQFSATADASGDYQINLRVHSNALVEVIAQGTGEQAFVLFTSMLGQVFSLVTAAGDDGVLTKDELTRVNVTNLSTAESVFVKAANDNQPLASDADLTRLLSQLDSGEVMQAAAAIKLVVDHDNYDLPDGVSDTVAFISNNEILSAFSDAAGADLAAAMQVIATDPELTAVTDLMAFLTNDGQSATFLLAEEGRRDGSYLTFNKSGSLIQFSSDGTGSIIMVGKTEPVSFAWQIDGNKLELTNVSFSASIRHRVKKGDNVVSVYGEQMIKHLQLSLINSTSTIADFSVDTDYAVNFTDYPAFDATGSMVSQWKLQRLPITGNVTSEQLTNGNTWYMPAYRPEIGDASLLFDGLIFAQDGSGIAASGNNFNWTINSEDLLTLNYADDSQVVYHGFYLNNDKLGNTTATLQKNTDFSTSRVSLFGLVVAQDTSLSVSEEMLAKRWHQFNIGENTRSSRTVFGQHFSSFVCSITYDGVNINPCTNGNNYAEVIFNDDISFKEQSGRLELGFAFYEDGYAHEMAFNRGDHGSFEANGRSLSSLSSTWQRIDGEKGLLIQQSWDENYADSLFCDYSNSDCNVYFYYQVYPLYLEGDRLYVYYLLGNEQDDKPDTITTSLAGVTFYTLAEPVVSQSKALSSGIQISDLKRLLD
ncbi:MAG: hypothetical protein GW836_17145 [Paraglaciecola sp.]|nr:hypothetical protein [Paraglaciecola sp.]